MSPKKKDEKFPPVRVSEELLKQTKECADAADEYLSDYIRKAVEQRNAQYKLGQDKPLDVEYSNSLTVELSKDNLKELTNKAKTQALQPKMVHTFLKGERK